MEYQQIFLVCNHFINYKENLTAYGKAIYFPAR
jgi:hypothetical protein